MNVKGTDIDYVKALGRVDILGLYSSRSDLRIDELESTT